MSSAAAALVSVPRMLPKHRAREYPYPWIYPPPGQKPFDFQGSIGLPAVGATATIFKFIVPPKYNGIIRAYANVFVGGGFTDGSGTIVWQFLHRNGLQPIQYYNNILAALGTMANPVYHPSGIRVLEDETIAVTVKNVSIVVAGQIVQARFMGWFYPKEYDDPNLRS